MTYKYMIPVIISNTEKRSCYDLLIGRLDSFIHRYGGALKVMHKIAPGMKYEAFRSDMVIEASFSSLSQLNKFLDSKDYKAVIRESGPAISDRAYMVREANFSHSPYIINYASGQ